MAEQQPTFAKRWKAIVARGTPALPRTPEEEAAITRCAANAAMRMLDAATTPRPPIIEQIARVRAEG